MEPYTFPYPQYTHVKSDETKSDAKYETPQSEAVDERPNHPNTIHIVTSR